MWRHVNDIFIIQAGTDNTHIGELRLSIDKEKKEMAAYLVGKLFDVKLVSGSKEKEMAKEFSGEKLLGLREDAAEENLEAPHISEKRSSKARVRVELFPLLHCRIKG